MQVKYVIVFAAGKGERQTLFGNRFDLPSRAIPIPDITGKHRCPVKRALCGSVRRGNGNAAFRCQPQAGFGKKYGAATTRIERRARHAEIGAERELRVRSSRSRGATA